MLSGNDFKKAAAGLRLDKETLRADIWKAATQEEEAPLEAVRRKRPVRALALPAAVLAVFCAVLLVMVPLAQRFFVPNTEIANPGFRYDGEYIEIYTAADLDAVRNNLTANYRLMADIVFADADFAEGGAFAGGWKPIGDSDRPFVGIFDGNGHIIYNLQVHSSKTYAGLFGVVGWDFSAANRKLSGRVINLGIFGGKIAAKGGQFVGAVAGFAYHIAGCFSEDIVIEVAGGNPDVPLTVGGIAGYAMIVDSCYSTAQIKAAGEPPQLDKGEPADTAGGIAGEAFVADACYFDGKIEAESFQIKGEILGIERFMPYVLTEAQGKRIISALNEKNPFNTGKLMALYTQLAYPQAGEQDAEQRRLEIDELRKVAGEFLTVSIPEDESPYLLASDTKRQERDQSEDILLMIGDRDSLLAEFRAGGMKVGMTSCYTPESGRAADFAGFDFKRIWVLRNGLPRLAIFEARSNPR